jgi:hypothetical protein
MARTTTRDQSTRQIGGSRYVARGAMSRARIVYEPAAAQALRLGARMSYWLGQACKEARGDRRQSIVAGLLQVDQATCSRFENGVAWPRDADRFVLGYANAYGIEDCRDIWQRAIDLWRQHGETADRLKPDGHFPDDGG